MEAMMEGTEKLAPITHVSINTGRYKVVSGVPSDMAPTQNLNDLSELIKGGGGPVPNTNGRYQLSIEAEDPVSFDFYIWKNNALILMCAYQDEPSAGTANWNDFLARTAPLGVIRKQEMPKSPWLLSSNPPDSLRRGGYVPWLNDFAETVADAWRRLPAEDRSPIISPSLDFLRPKLSHKKTEKTEFDPQAYIQAFQKQLAHLCRTNDRLHSQIRSMAKVNEDMAVKLREINALRQEVDCLMKQAAVTDASIQSLERANAALESEVEERVSSQVALVRKAAEDNEFRALLAEEERVEANRRAESAEHKLKHLEQWLRRQGLDPAMAYPQPTDRREGEAGREMVA